MRTSLTLRRIVGIRNIPTRNQEEDELEDVQHQFLAGKGLRDGHRGEEDHQEDGDQVFDDQRAEDHPRIGLLLQAEILVGFDDDHRR